MPAILVSYRGEHPASPWYSTGRVQWDGLADAGIVLCLASIGLCLAGIVTWAPFWICGLSRASVGVGVQQFSVWSACRVRPGFSSGPEKANESSGRPAGTEARPEVGLGQTKSYNSSCPEVGDGSLISRPTFLSLSYRSRVRWQGPSKHRNCAPTLTRRQRTASTVTGP